MRKDDSRACRGLKGTRNCSGVVDWGEVGGGGTEEDTFTSFRWGQDGLEQSALSQFFL